MATYVQGVLSLDAYDLEGQTVLYRVDVNSPLNPIDKTLLDDSRLRTLKPTLQLLSKSKVVILAHQSRPGKDDFSDMSQHSARLSQIINRDIMFIKDICSDSTIDKIRDMKNGDILFLDNMRIHSEEYSKKYENWQNTEESEIVTKLSSVADLYVTDAFAAAHRKSPTLTGFTTKLPCIPGNLMMSELSNLRTAIDNPPRPYLAILGGAKADDSLRVALNLIQKNIIDKIAFVGVVGNLMIWANGYDIGNRNKDFITNLIGDAFDETWVMAQKLVKQYPDLLILPTDIAVEINEERIPMQLDELPTEYPIYDVGLQSLMNLRPIILNSKCILWNGPASFFEKPGFAFGTIEILNMCIETEALTIIGGGHTSALVSSRGVVDKVTHNSTGGGSTMCLLSGENMPVIESLIKSATIFSDNS
ncbi:MAG: phosphoglycerate kinase [Euryarchaeota archaeon]|nr:phosphoglycerate kinase [Euryarchaeota archaeon]